MNEHAEQGFNWTFLYIMLIVFWPVSVWNYRKAAVMMKKYGVMQWGGMNRSLYIGLAMVWIPIVTFLYFAAVLLMC